MDRPKRYVDKPERCGDCEYYKRRKIGDGICDLPFRQQICRADETRIDCPLPGWDFVKES